MGSAYPIELRERALAAIDAGMSKWEAHQTFKVSRSTLDDWLKLRKRNGSLEPVKYRRGPKPVIINSKENDLFFEEHQHKTLAQLCELWFKKTGQRVSDVTMSKTLKRFGYTRKKRAIDIKSEMS